MRKVTQTYDINAHITNVDTRVVVEDNIAKAIITFENLGYGVVTAVKFNAKGYNSFGDLVPVSGNDNFLIIIQDITVKSNEKSSEIKIQLPNSEIRKIEVEESQICYSDGSITTYEGKKEQSFELEEFTYEENEAYNALKDVFDKKVKYVLSEVDEGWICTCGRFNKNDCDKCSLCGHTKQEIINVLSEEGMQKAIEDKKLLDLKRQKEAEEKAKEKAVSDKKKAITIGIVAVVAIFFICIISNTITMGKRQTYSSVEAMRTAMQGKWTHYSTYSSKSPLWQWEIEGDKAYRIYKTEDDRGYGYDIKWNPSKGTFNIGSNTVVVESGGRSFIEDGDEVYEKGGYLLSSSNSSTYSSYESAYSALKLSSVSVTNNSSYTVCTGTITNNGKKTYKFVKVKGAFKNSSGTVVDTDWTYAVGSEGLAPGESSTFRMSVNKKYDISTCTVSIYDYK